MHEDEGEGEGEQKTEEEKVEEEDWHSGRLWKSRVHIGLG